MALVGLREVCMGFGGPLLLDHVNFHLEERERVCLLGRNGAGKSTLLRLLKGDLTPDRGEIVYQQGVRLSLLPQEAPAGLTGTVLDIVAGGQSDSGAASAKDFGGRGPSQVEKIVSLMDLNPCEQFETLSAGLKRRVMLARGLVCDPDVLLLDEPTNHLDIEAINWMEDFLLRYSGTLLFVTHDRMFLRKLATRTLELDRGRLVDWACDYDTFQKRRQAALRSKLGTGSGLVRNWIEKRPGFGRESRQDEPGMRAEFESLKNCARPGAPAVNSRALFACMRRRLPAPANLSSKLKT